MTGPDTISDPFRQRLSAKPILADGGMGTLLYERGVTFERSFDELNLSSGKLIIQVHQDYLRAGAELLETNTFGANRTRLAGFGHENKVHEINFHGAKLAREAREIEGKAAFVAGSLGPLGKNLVPIGEVTVGQATDIFVEQVEALLEGGVDLFIIETMTSLAELKSAINAVRQTTNLPLIAQMSFTEDGKTYLGDTLEAMAVELAGMSVDVLGINCAVGPQLMLEIIWELARHTDRPLSVMPNAGLPSRVDGRFMYDTSPAYFASFVQPYVDLGAKVIGGCCGTTPEHIRAIAGVLNKQQLMTADDDERCLIKPGLADFGITDKTPLVDDRVEGAEQSEFAQQLGKKFLVSIELDPPKGTNPQKILRGAELFKRHGVDAVNIADSPMARVRMSAVAAAAMIKHDVGIEPILHFTCRDRNLMGLQSDLIGAHALGVRNVLAVTGDPPSVGDFPGASGVYDVDAIGLVKILNKLNAGQDFAGSSIGKGTSFTIGVASNPTAEDSARETTRFFEKVDAGAHFTFTQPLYELDLLQRFLDRLGGKPIPVFLGLLPLMSYRHALFMHHEVPGITIPRSHLEAMEKAGKQGAEVGVELCRELLYRAEHLVDGVYLMPSFNRYETCLEVVKDLLQSRTLGIPAGLAGVPLAMAT